MKNRRSAILVATPVLSLGIARAAVWVGLGAVARSRGIGWRTGLAAVLGVYYNRHDFRDPFMTTTTTEEHNIIRIKQRQL